MPVQQIGGITAVTVQSFQPADLGDSIVIAVRGGGDDNAPGQAGCPYPLCLSDEERFTSQRHQHLIRQSGRSPPGLNNGKDVLIFHVHEYYL